MVRESAAMAVDALRVNRGRTFLASAGIVIGIVTVVLVASTLANLRNQVALLFRELGTENVFAFHITGDPYQPAAESEANRRPLRPEYAAQLERLGDAIREVAVQVIVPTVANGLPLVARAGDNESDTLLLEGASPNFFDVAGAEFAAGRPFTEVEDRSGARVAVIGASLARALYGGSSAVGRRLVLSGETYTVVGELARRKGGFFGENRQDSVMAIPIGTVLQRFSDADRTVLYVRALPGRRDEAREETGVILRLLRQVPPGEPDDFTLSTADSIIRTFDEISVRIGLATVALAAVSLVIGGIGIANVMLIAVTERTREIGIRLAVGARRREVLTQFLLEAAMLSVMGGAGGVLVALALGLLTGLFVSGFSAVPPLWAVASGLAASVTTGILAGYWPARRAASLDPIDALRYE